MDVDYDRLAAAVAATVEELEAGLKEPTRRPRVRIDVVRDLQGEVTAGPFRYRTDAARDAGGFGEHPRPMDYLLGALASCQQMWCLRWAALRKLRFSELVIETGSVFDWHGEYLQQIDAGASELQVVYRIAGDGIDRQAAIDMADTVARRCPVYATLRRAALVTEELRVQGEPAIVRQWKPGVAHASMV